MTGSIYISPFRATGLFLYHLKTSENQEFPMSPEGIQREQWHETVNPDIY